MPRARLISPGGKKKGKKEKKERQGEGRVQTGQEQPDGLSTAPRRCFRLSRRHHTTFWRFQATVGAGCARRGASWAAVTLRNTCYGDRVAPQPVCSYVKRCVASRRSSVWEASLSVRKGMRGAAAGCWEKEREGEREGDGSIGIQEI